MHFNLHACPLEHIERHLTLGVPNFKPAGAHFLRAINDYFANARLNHHVGTFKTRAVCGGANRIRRGFSGTGGNHNRSLLSMQIKISKIALGVAYIMP